MSYYIDVGDGVENQPHPVRDQNGEYLLRDSNKGRNLGVVKSTIFYWNLGDGWRKQSIQV